jgi:hypothetical protein
MKNYSEKIITDYPDLPTLEARDKDLKRLEKKYHQIQSRFDTGRVSSRLEIAEFLSEVKKHQQHPDNFCQDCLENMTLWPDLYFNRLENKQKEIVQKHFNECNACSTSYIEFIINISAKEILSPHAEKFTVSNIFQTYQDLNRINHQIELKRPSN